MAEKFEINNVIDLATRYKIFQMKLMEMLNTEGAEVNKEKVKQISLECGLPTPTTNFKLNQNYYEEEFNARITSNNHYTLGSVDEVFEQKNQAQCEHGLEPTTENPAKVIARMPPISPLLAGAECLEIQNQAEGRRQVTESKISIMIFYGFSNSILRNNRLWIQILLGDDRSTSGNNTSTDDDTTTIMASTIASSLSSSESMTSLASDASSIDLASTLLMKELP
ncbi:unnamed protein product [Rotaria sordida]|uniref:Uncharacterized protein n=1 Tax=Rotaria sordida TaxID=392033 RepID=A0A815HPA3_9BILA|nr:unnamed protein product [Rotaria sordida]CAF1355225.1 unnamed protein product [Rotaria sordida]